MKHLSVKSYTVLAMTLLCFILPFEVQAGDEVQFVQSAYQKLVEFDAPKSSATSSKALKTVNALFDFDAFFKKTAQDLYEKLSGEEYVNFKESFQFLFSGNMAKNGWRLSGKKLVSPRFRLKRKEGNETLVVVMGKVNERKVTLEFTLLPKEESWGITDIAVEGASLSRQYRAQFNRIYRNEGYKGLMGRMQKKLASL